MGCIRFKASVLPALIIATAGLSAACAQHIPVNTEQKGAITGLVTYVDTKTPARAAQIMLLKVVSGPNPPAEKTTANPLGMDMLSKSGLNGFAQTRLDGSFQLDGVPAGRYVVLAQQQGAVNPLDRLDLQTLNEMPIMGLREDRIKNALPYLTVVTVRAGHTEHAQITLTHGATISGMVTYDDGSPVVGAQVHLMTKTADGSFAEPTNMTAGMAASNASLTGYITDDTGHFRIPGLMPGTYALRVTLQLDLFKDLTAKIKGIFRIGMSSPGALASATKYDNGLTVYSGNVFSPADLKPIALREGEAQTEASVMIPLKGLHSLQVHVEDSATGKAIGVAQVRLLDGVGKVPLRACFIDDDGNCTFDYVPDGSYTLDVEAALDTSAVGKLGAPGYDPSKAVNYGTARAKVEVRADVAGVVLRVAKVKSGTGAQK